MVIKFNIGGSMMKKVVTMLMLVVMMFFSTVAFAAEGYFYAKNRVNVRKSANASAKVLGVLESNEIVYGKKVVKDKTGKEWMYVETQFGNGYVSKNSLSVCHDYDDTSYVPKPVTVKVAKTIKVTALNGKTGTLKKGAKVQAIRFFPTKNGAKAQIKVGKYECYVWAKDLRKTNGQKIPTLPRKVSLKKAYHLNGEKLSKGQILNVESYFFNKSGTFCADVHEGYIPVSLLNKA